MNNWLFDRFSKVGIAALSVCFLGLATSIAAAQREDRQRQLADSVLETIPPSIDLMEGIHLHDMIEIRAKRQLEWTPKTFAPSRTLFAIAANTPFLHEVWCLEFSFKPLRMIEVDVPQPAGGTQRKTIWYLVYRVRNIGAGISGELGDDGEYAAVKKSIEPVRFYPEFVLVSHDRAKNGTRTDREYLDRIVPAAIDPIRRRELIPGQLYNSVEMPENPLVIEEGRMTRGVWGVAMWEDVDPTIDFLSVYVGGLTNAMRWADDPVAFNEGDKPGKGRAFTRKTLQLNFWRPGDQYEEDEREIRFGVPDGSASLYGSREGVAYQWEYR